MSEPTGQSVLWLPPEQMKRYHRVRIGGGALLALIFLGWMVLQWSNPVMRWLAGGLAAVTVWITAAAVWRDVRRGRGRQITLIVQPAAFIIDTPGRHQRIDVNRIARAEWREETDDAVGLWLFDAEGTVLAHLDAAFLADQAEARTFLAWARRYVDLPFAVHWPETAAPC